MRFVAIVVFSVVSVGSGSRLESLASRVDEKTDLSELLDELDLVDDEDLFPLRIGNSFCHLPAEEVREHLEASLVRLGKDIEEFEEKVEDVKKENDELKVLL